MTDDRDQLSDGDRVVLVVEDDAEFARTVQEVARERGFKGLVALRGDTGLALAHEYKPDAIVLDFKLPVIDGATLLDRLKHHPATRHIPVHIVSGGDGRQQALRAGAVAFLEKPVAREGLEDTFASTRDLHRPRCPQPARGRGRRERSARRSSSSSASGTT